MKKIILISLVAISSMAFAAETMVKGTISSMDMKAKTMEVKAEDGSMMMMSMMKNTMVKMMDGKKSKMSMMKVGDMVEVSYDTKGDKKIAKSIMMMPATPAAAPAATPATK